jgi:hypothetical protein
LSTNHVSTGSTGFLDMLGVPDHVLHTRQCEHRVNRFQGTYHAIERVS